MFNNFFVAINIHLFYLFIYSGAPTRSSAMAMYARRPWPASSTGSFCSSSPSSSSLRWTAVFRIHDILVWIRIRIRGSRSLTNGSGSGSCYFRHWPSRCQQKTNFLTQFFLLVTFWRYIFIIFQRLKVKKSHKIVGFKVFLIIFAWW